MRRIVPALVFTVFATVRFASAAAISVAGTDCGTDRLLGLTFLAPGSGTNLPFVVGSTGVACPGGNLGVGRLIGDPTSGDPIGPLYGFDITSLQFEITHPEQLGSGLEILKGSQFGGVRLTDTGFILFDEVGIHISCSPPSFDAFPGFGVCSPRDAVIGFSGFLPGTGFTVTAIDGIPAVPEPATLTLVASGLGAALARRRARRRP